VVEQDEALDPPDIRFFGAVAVVPRVNRIADLIQEFARLWRSIRLGSNDTRLRYRIGTLGRLASWLPTRRGIVPGVSARTVEPRLSRRTYRLGLQ